MGSAVKHLLEFGPFRIDPDQRILLRGERPIPLSPKAFDLLLALVRRSGRVVLKDDLMKTLWPDTFVEESNLGQHVFQLRKALGERAQKPAYIVTVPGRGYRFTSAVRALPIAEEHIVIESHSRSRLVIEEKIADGSRVRDSGLIVLPERAPRTLPPALSNWSRGRTLILLLAGAVLGAVAVWFVLRPLPIPKVLRSSRITQFGGVEPFSQALSDDARIFLAERIGGTWSLAEVSGAGGQPQLISTSVQNVALFDIDRRRSKLLVGARRPSFDTGDALWIVPTTGGSGRRVGDLLADAAAWSPDAQTIVYSHFNELFLAADDGSRSRRIFTAPGSIEYLRWSPDGERISFTVNTLPGVLSLWEISPEGKNAHAISFGWKAPISRWGEGECCGDWSPDGKYFIFRSFREGVFSLWGVEQKAAWFERRRKEPVQLYTTPDRLNEPRFSADGKRIIFVHSQERRELVRYDSERKLFVPYLGGIAARHLSFSRDGQWVAYKNEHDGTLWRSRIDGSQAMQLTFPPLDTYHPTWSPDGKRIAFEGDGELYIVPFEGGRAEPIFPGNNEDNLVDRQPSWSPNSNALVFTRHRSTEDVTRRSVYLLNLDTRQVESVPGSTGFEDPQWSPDGKYIAAGSRPAQKLMLYDFRRQQWSELADGSPYGWGLRWSVDSKYVYYQHPFDGEEQPIFRARVSDRKVEQITSSRHMLRADVLSYAMTGLTPDNSPLVSLSRRNSDVYALELELP